MPNRCNVVNCKGNYDDNHRSRVFRLPKNENERKSWLDALPPRKDFVINPSRFFICEKHWPDDVEMKILPGGASKPVCAPSIFDVPKSCLPTPKPKPRPQKSEDKQYQYFVKKDKIPSFTLFNPDKELNKKYDNCLIKRTDDTFICIFMTHDYKETSASIIVQSKSTLCSPLTLHAFKNGMQVPLSKILNPNNGLSTYSQFYAAVHIVLNYEHDIDTILGKVLDFLQSNVNEDTIIDLDKAKRLQFLTRQLSLLKNKSFTVSDYCFALECYPKTNYDFIRDVLVLPSARKLQSIVSSTGIEKVLLKTFQIVTAQQKNCFLIIDEVKIRPTVAYSGGVLNGFSKNDPDAKASSMLCVMLKCLHGGPSVMISVTPVHKLTANYQFQIVKEAAQLVESSGGVVLGSITDNHRINQQFCKLFQQTSADYQAIHPLDSSRFWFLLFDTVHLLKCIRNNWITEKCQKLSFDNNNTVGSFSDVKDLYQEEKKNVLKCTPLTQTAVNPSKLQLQNVRHVLRVFNDRVYAALKQRNATDTAKFVKEVLDWWNVVNVSQKGSDLRLRDPCRSVQTLSSTSLEKYLFNSSQSGHGAKRIQSLTHDTKKALVQTMGGLIAVRDHLLSNGFEYVLLREIQSDRIEGEFSVYRQSTGANAFISASDVFFAYKKRLARFAAHNLSSVETSSSARTHTCNDRIDEEDAIAIEGCIRNVTLSETEEWASAYVAGWLEAKCQQELSFSDEEPIVSSEISDFIQEVSRGGLTIPHQSTHELVRIGLCFVNHAKHKACCRQRLVKILAIMDDFYNLQLSSKQVSDAKAFIRSLLCLSCSKLA